jgi:hypothetical protein
MKWTIDQGASFDRVAGPGQTKIANGFCCHSSAGLAPAALQVAQCQKQRNESVDVRENGGRFPAKHLQNGFQLLVRRSKPDHLVVGGGV